MVVSKYKVVRDVLESVFDNALQDATHLGKLNINNYDEFRSDFIAEMYKPWTEHLVIKNIDESVIEERRDELVDFLSRITTHFGPAIKSVSDYIFILEFYYYKKDHPLVLKYGIDHIMTCVGKLYDFFHKTNLSRHDIYMLNKSKKFEDEVNGFNEFKSSLRKTINLQFDTFLKSAALHETTSYGEALRKSLNFAIDITKPTYHSQSTATDWVASFLPAELLNPKKGRPSDTTFNEVLVFISELLSENSSRYWNDVSSLLLQVREFVPEYFTLVSAEQLSPSTLRNRVKSFRYSNNKK